MEAKHTPTPWHRNIKPATKYNTIWSGRNTHVARVVVDGLPSEEIEANLDFIVRACNSHDDLVAALQQAAARIRLANGAGNPILSAWLTDAEAALAKAGAV